MNQTFQNLDQETFPELNTYAATQEQPPQSPSPKNTNIKQSGARKRGAGWSVESTIGACFITALVVGIVMLMLLGYALAQGFKDDSTHAYASEIVQVGDLKYLCLTDHKQPISCQLVSPLTDDMINELPNTMTVYKHATFEA